MRKAEPIFSISHRLADKSCEIWVRERQAAERRQPAWLSRPADWKKREWAIVRRAFDAGARWMLKPFQQVCGFERSPAGTRWDASWKQCRKGVMLAGDPLEDAVRRAWHHGRVFLELWIQKERIPG